MSETEAEQIEAEPHEEKAYALGSDVVSAVRSAVAKGDALGLAEVFEPLHAADIADLLEQVDQGTRRDILRLGVDQIDGDVLSEIDESIRDEVVEFLPNRVVAEAVRDLESDDVVDLIEDLEDEQAEVVLEALEDADRAAVEAALSYPEETAGRLMQREVVAAPAHWSVGEAIDFMRGHDDLPEQFYHIILVDPRHRPTGYVTLGKVMSAPRARLLADITEDSFRTIPVAQDEGEVAYAFNQYHLISAPVVDENERLVGVITIDDAMAILDEEHEEDILRLAGVGEESLASSPFEIMRRRFPWLFVNLVTAILASLVIAQFDDIIGVIVALAVLMPIVASMGGNAGTQSLTVAVRALATKDLTGSNAWRVIRREVLAGLMSGVVFAFIMGVIGMVWFGMPALGVVIGAAMVINLVVAGLAGIVVPLTLDKFEIDPALASGAFVTTVTDVVGFFAFLGLARMVLL